MLSIHRTALTVGAGAAAFALAATAITTAASYTVAVIPPGYTSPFHVAVKDGAVEEAQKLGWTIDTASAASESDFNQQANIVDDEVSKKVNIISVNPIDPNADIGAIKRANAAKIPVLVHNGITPLGGGVKVVEYIGYNQWKGAKLVGEEACKLLGGKGEVFILDGIVEFHTHRRAGGFKDGLKSCMGAAGVKIDGEQSASWLRTQGQQVATAALTKYPNIKLFFGCSDEMDIGASIAARRLHKTVFTLGIDGNQATLDEIKAGHVTGTLGVYPKQMGVTIVEQMQKVLGGQSVPAILETPGTVVTKDNLDAYLGGKTFTAPKSGQPEEDSGHE
jgi:ABC-type sugar transport system substrate-binding protein